VFAKKSDSSSEMLRHARISYLVKSVLYDGGMKSESLGIDALVNRSKRMVRNKERHTILNARKYKTY
jgi:hypothetical protein